MREPRIVVNGDEVLKAIESSKRPLSETEILLAVLSDQGLQMREDPGEAPRSAIRKHFHIAEFQRCLRQLKADGYVENLTGKELTERGHAFYDQRAATMYWMPVPKAPEPPKARVHKVAPTPRQRIHKAFCATEYECKYEGARDRSVWCTVLDDLLDHNDEQLLHAKARELDARWENMPTRQRNAHGPGVVWSVREIDPYEEVEHGGVADYLSPKAVDGYKNCPACESGAKHYHRKSDDSIVKAPVKEAGT